MRLKKGEVSAKIEKSQEPGKGKKCGGSTARQTQPPGKEIRRGSRFDTYTPLVAPPEQVLLQIWEHHNLRWPATWSPKSKRSPTYGNGRLCKFHNDYGHSTDERSHLKDEIDRLIRDNKL